MRLMAVMSGYLPAQNYGGPVRSLSNLVDRIGDRVEIDVVCGDHEFRQSQPLPGLSEGWNQVGNAQVLYLQEKEFTRSRFTELFHERKPDLLYLSSIFSFRQTYPALLAAKAAGIPVILAPRGELEPNALRRKGIKKRPFLWIMRAAGIYRGMCFHATSPGEAADIRRALHPSRIAILPNLPVSSRKKDTIQKQTGRLRVCCIARILPNKNQLLAIQAAAAAKGEITLDLYGPLEDEAYWERCEEAIRQVQPPVVVRYRGVLPPQEVGKTLLNYDCSLLPTVFENYCHSIAEALLHDCPVVISRGTTPWDDIAPADCGRAVPLEHPEGFSEALSELAAMDADAYGSMIARLRGFCAKRFCSDEMEREYLSLFEELTGKEQHEARGQ